MERTGACRFDQSRINHRRRLAPLADLYVSPQSRNMSHIIRLLLAVTVLFLSGCGPGARKVSLSDQRVAPMLQAIAAVDRAALGFTPIPTNAEVLLVSRSDARCDATLIIFDTPARYSGVYRNIEFRKMATGYRCFGSLRLTPARGHSPRAATQRTSRFPSSMTPQAFLGSRPTNYTFNITDWTAGSPIARTSPSTRSGRFWPSGIRGPET